MRVLVTGATSMLGRAVVDRLMERGTILRVFQRHPAGGPDQIEEHLGSVADSEAVSAAVDGCDAVIHLAARVSVVGNWSDFEATNISGTRNVIDASIAGAVERVVHISTPSVAHMGHSLVGAEAGPANPAGARGHYARSKAEAELIALAANGDGLSVVALRPHLVWGPGDTQLIGRIVERARSGRLALVGSGAALIDTTYVDNAADAIVAALDRAHEVAGQALVISNGQPRTVKELLDRITAAAGVDGPRRHVPTPVATRAGALAERIWERLGRDEDPPMTSFLAEQLGTAHWFDQRSTREALQWTPAISLDEGFRRLEAWFETAGRS